MSKLKVIQQEPITCESMGVVATLSPFILNDSPSRAVMDAHHQSQAPTVHSPDVDRCLTGFEKQMPTFDIVMPCDGIIISVHHKYPRGLGIWAINENCLITIIYRCHDGENKGMYDTLSITTHHSKHMTYGTKYILEPIVSQLRKGLPLKKGTVLARNPSKKHGLFTAGLSCSSISMSHPTGAEDGYLVSRSFCERGALLELPTITGSWGSKTYPLNTYGTPDGKIYKPFPSIGSIIRPDGLVFAFRTYNQKYDALEMGSSRLSDPNNIDTMHDIKVYSTPGAYVYDIEIVSGKDETKQKPNTPLTMMEQAESYIGYTRAYYDGILETYYAISRDKVNLMLSQELTKLIVRALGDRPNARGLNSSGIIRRTIKKIPIDEYVIKVKAYYKRKLHKGSKIAGKHGNKGVICGIMEDKDRPVDIHGNVVDVIKYEKAIISRMIAGQVYEQYINGASRDLVKDIRTECFNLYAHLQDNNPRFLTDELFYQYTNNLSVDFRNIVTKETVDKIWERLLSYYEIVSPLMYNACLKVYNTYTGQLIHLEKIIKYGIYLVIPPDNQNINPAIFEKIENLIKPTYDRIWYTNLAGQRVRTKGKVFVGHEQFIVLEKSDQQPMAVSSGSLQHHGMLSRSTKVNRNSHPGKVHPVRAVSETEGRMLGCFTGMNTLNKMALLANSPDAHRVLIEALCEAERPSLLPELKLPNGSSRARRLITSVFTGVGLEIRGTDYVNN